MRVDNPWTFLKPHIKVPHKSWTPALRNRKISTYKSNNPLLITLPLAQNRTQTICWSIYMQIKGVRIINVSQRWSTCQTINRFCKRCLLILFPNKTGITGFPSSLWTWLSEQIAEGLTTLWVMSDKFPIEQERPLGQRKTPPANKLLRNIEINVLIH